MDVLGPLLLVVGAHASSAICAGHYAGLWKVLSEHDERKWSLQELCEAADCKERWVREWVGVMAGAGIIKLEEGMIISVSPEVAAELHPDKELICFFSSLEYCFDKEPKIGACFKKSGPLGVPYSEYPNFQDWMASWSESRNKAQES